MRIQLPYSQRSAYFLGIKQQGITIDHTIRRHLIPFNIFKLSNHLSTRGSPAGRHRGAAPLPALVAVGGLSVPPGQAADIRVTGLRSAPAGAPGGARTAASASARGATGCASREHAEAPGKPASGTQRSRKKKRLGQGHRSYLENSPGSRTAAPQTEDEEEEEAQKALPWPFPGPDHMEKAPLRPAIGSRC